MKNIDAKDIWNYLRNVIHIFMSFWLAQNCIFPKKKFSLSIHFPDLEGERSVSVAVQLEVAGSMLLGEPSKHHPAHFTSPCSPPPEGFPSSLRCLGRQRGEARAQHASPFSSRV